MSGKYLIAGNWKMNGLCADIAVIRRLADFCSSRSNLEKCVDIGVFVPATLLADCRTIHGVLIGGQDCHHLESGAFTGSITAGMLADQGADAVIIGHSETRLYHNVTDEQVALKVQQAQKESLSVIMCCGEDLQQHESGDWRTILENQLRKGLSLIDPSLLQHRWLCIAYEPVWAIGTGRAAHVSHIEEACGFIKKTLLELLPQDSVRLLYGGSVNSSNADSIASLADVDGFLVGGASLTYEGFTGIISNFLSRKL